MLELIRKNAVLYVKVLMNLRIPVKYQNKLFNKKEGEELLLPEEVLYILTRNGNIKLWDGKKYIKMGLGQFHEVIQHKKYFIKDYVEPKKEEPKPQPKVEPKVEKPIEVKEEPKEEVKEVVKEEPKQHNENKKQRHNNNNKQQGGDK